jgi:hypothetical protein
VVVFLLRLAFKGRFAFVGCYVENRLEEITRVTDASEQERNPLSRRRAKRLIEQRFGGVVTNGIVLRSVDSVLVLVHAYLSRHL